MGDEGREGGGGRGGVREREGEEETKGEGKAGYAHHVLNVLSCSWKRGCVGTLTLNYQMYDYINICCAIVNKCI